mmetsp:Transcript_13726/g.23668  ORF Transcript_13726/g.23668 Transcript_13726/m.23668 type:complete len:218 (-) Transcript_13726:27-680(-)
MPAPKNFKNPACWKPSLGIACKLYGVSRAGPCKTHGKSNPSCASSDKSAFTMLNLRLPFPPSPSGPSDTADAIDFEDALEHGDVGSFFGTISKSSLRSETRPSLTLASGVPLGANHNMSLIMRFLRMFWVIESLANTTRNPADSITCIRLALSPGAHGCLIDIRTAAPSFAAEASTRASWRVVILRTSHSSSRLSLAFGAFCTSLSIEAMKLLIGDA